jgi:hypothetical protein
MNKGVKRSNTGYKGLADISTIQGFEPHPRFGHRTRIYLHMWVVRDSNPDPVIKSYQINDTQTGLKEIYPVI